MRQLFLLPLFVQVLAAFWALYTTLAAIKSWHAFGWWRAIASYLMGLLILLVPVVLIVVVLRPAG